MRRARCPRQGGFTLIEIMAVVLLLGLMMSGVSIGLDRFLPGQQIDGQAREVLSNLDLARSSAISAGRPYRMVLNLDEHWYRIYTPYDSEGRIAKSKDEQTSLGKKVLESGVNFSGVLDHQTTQITQEGEVEFVFPASGIMLDVILYLSSDAGGAYDKTVHLGGLTGRAEIREGHDIPGKVTDADFD